MGEAASAKTPAEEFALTYEGSQNEWGVFQYNLLVTMSEFHFDNAMKMVKDYQELRTSYNLYRKQTEKIYEGLLEIIQLIKSKLETPGLRAMLPNKQEEVFEAVYESWDIFKSLLKRLRAVERELATEDARSTLIVVKAIIFSVTMILVVFIITEIFRSVGKSFTAFLEDAVKSVIKLF